MPGNSFLGVFAKSPLKPLEDHINVVHDCSQQLLPFFEAVFKEDWQEAERLQKSISQLEKKADVIKRELRTSLPSGIFMPIQRQDLLDLLTQQDKIANKAKDISGRVIGRELPIPSQLQEDFMTYLVRCLDATGQAQKVINELDDLLETGFKGREVRLVEDMIEHLDRIEDETDGMQVAIRRKLRAIEAELNPVDVVFLYSIIEWVGGLADTSERVGSRLELMLAN
ncbi:TIGR00153 family protein [Alteromonas sp. ASW11-130]|uniref:TIGR00153 family protein n=1 Tax=Alteromonas sp. ASW11-130 TaxID=3015775 RepID=UPI002241DF9E|nr:TIGR00153 family protein [Alteromonas sp. ASW11-130]MCW8092747.1 TIGR00153 family protein [Alteromonas sp. ASW11-130]